MVDQHIQKCPLGAVDKRLSDLHRQWHAAENAYFEPDGFRSAIQTAIQTLRTVTFILQSNKRLIPDFHVWYAQRQQEMKDDHLLRWMVDARNRIEKQGDLEAHSFVRAELIASYLEGGPRVEIPATLFQSPRRLLKNIPDDPFGRHIRKQGVLRIERRWVENSLPDHELLDAVAIAYGKIALLVVDAHRQVGLTVPESIGDGSGHRYPLGAAGGRLPCMVGHADFRSDEFSVSTGAKISRVAKRIKLEIKDAPKLVARYGMPVRQIWSEENTPKSHLLSLFNTARKVFLGDGHHVIIVFLLKDGIPVSINQLAPEDQGDKYLLMRTIAHEVTKHGADAVIAIGEAWMATYSAADPFRRPAESPSRTEFLTATLVMKLDDPVALSAQISRKSGKISLGPTIETSNGMHFLFGPVYHAWGKPIPAEWQANPPLTAGDGA